MRDGTHSGACLVGSGPGRFVILVLLNLLIIVCVAAGFEIGLRRNAVRLPVNGRFRGFTYTWGHRVIPNRHGFREKLFDVPKPPGAYRVMVLGDSLTWGAGLAEKQRYSNLLEGLLRSRYPRRNIEVLNFGLSGGATVRELDILKRHVENVDPDLIVIGFCLNDTQSKDQRYSVERERYQRLFEGISGLRRIGLARVSEELLRRVTALLERTGRIPGWREALQRTYDKDSDDWKDFVEALNEIRAISDSRGLPPPVFAVLNQGTSSIAPTDYGNPDETLKLYLQWYRQAEEAAKKAGYTTVNFEKEFATELAGEVLSINPLDGHPSSRCNEVYAKKLSEEIAPSISLGSGLDIGHR